MELNPDVAIPIVAREGYRRAAKKLNHPRSTLFDFIHKWPGHLRRYEELRKWVEVNSKPAASKKPAKEQLTLEEAIGRLPYPFHPAATIFPLGTLDSLLSLAVELKDEGQKQAIEVFEGQILDGRKRAIASVLAGFKGKYRKLRVARDPFQYVFDLHKPRGLGKSSLACCAVLALPYYEQTAKERQLRCLKRGLAEPVGLEVGQREPSGRSAQIVADLFGVSRELVNQAKKLHTKSPLLFARVHNGELSMGAALKEFTATEASPAEDSGPDAASPKNQSPAVAPSVTEIQALLEYLREHRPSACESLESERGLLAEIEQRLLKLV